MKIYKETILKYLSEGNVIQNTDFDYLNLCSNSKENIIDFNSKNLSTALINFIIDNDDLLNNAEKAELTLTVFDKNENKLASDFWKTTIRGLNTIIELYEKHLKALKYNFDFNLEGKIIPVYLEVSLINGTKYNPRHIVMSFNFKILDDLYKREFRIFTNDLLEFKMKNEKLDFEIFFSKFFLYPQKLNIDKYELLLAKTHLIQQKSGEQFWSIGNGFIAFNSKSINLTRDNIIIEKTLEYESNNRNNRLNDIPKNHTDLPYVRIFSLSKKRYFYLHINDIIEYIYDKNAEDKLILEEKNKKIVNQVFSKKYSSFEDIVKDKGKGIIILAVGESGIGKTSTAEVYSELHQKSLYILQIEELGIYIENIEKNLSVILQRINKWNSVLLLDEVDVFLSHRNNDLEKSAIVGVFLRLLEYFEGVIFFTSNRLEVIDHAVMSRVTLVLQFPKLSIDARKQIWKENFKTAKIVINSVDKLSRRDLSGRDIRNYIKLCTYVFSKEVLEQEVLQLIDEFPKN